jgi:hypothetical protein
MPDEVKLMLRNKETEGNAQEVWPKTGQWETRGATSIQAAACYVSEATASPRQWTPSSSSSAPWEALRSTGNISSYGSLESFGVRSDDEYLVYYHTRYFL